MSAFHSTITCCSLVDKDILQCTLIEFNKSSTFIGERYRNPESGGKLYWCGICYKEFTTAFSLKRHQSIHNPNFRKYQCHMCSRHFTWFDNLRAHMVGIHGVKMKFGRSRSEKWNQQWIFFFDVFFPWCSFVTMGKSGASYPVQHSTIKK